MLCNILNNRNPPKVRMYKKLDMNFCHSVDCNSSHFSFRVLPNWSFMIFFVPASRQIQLSFRVSWNLRFRTLSFFHMFIFLQQTVKYKSKDYSRLVYLAFAWIFINQIVIYLHAACRSTWTEQVKLFFRNHGVRKKNKQLFASGHHGHHCLQNLNSKQESCFAHTSLKKKWSDLDLTRTKMVRNWLKTTGQMEPHSS